jgi:hypothetical protein
MYKPAVTRTTKNAMFNVVFIVILVHIHYYFHVIEVAGTGIGTCVCISMSYSVWSSLVRNYDHSTVGCTRNNLQYLLMRTYRLDKNYLKGPSGCSVWSSLVRKYDHSSEGCTRNTFRVLTY